VLAISAMAPPALMKFRLRILSPPVFSSVGQSGAPLEYQSSGKAVKVAFDWLRLKCCSHHVDVQPIAESSFRDEVLRSLWIGLDFGAQLADADPQTKGGRSKNESVEARSPDVSLRRAS
jgi:hypothetical protein